MRSRLALAIIIAFVLGLFPGCRDITLEEYHQARAERAEAEAKLADIEAQLKTERETAAEARKELETSQQRVTELETELKECQTKVTELEEELEICLAQLPAEETTSSPSPTPLLEQDLKYRGYELKLTYVRVTILTATWDDNTLTVSWKLTNTSNRKIYLSLLQFEAYDQMYLRGEHVYHDVAGDNEIDYSEEPIVIYPDLQDDILTPWPGESLDFTTTWKFGPVSEEITIEFSPVRDESVYVEYPEEILPLFIIKR